MTHSCDLIGDVVIVTGPNTGTGQATAHGARAEIDAFGLTPAGDTVSQARVFGRRAVVDTDLKATSYLRQATVRHKIAHGSDRIVDIRGGIHVPSYTAQLKADEASNKSVSHPFPTERRGKSGDLGRAAMFPASAPVAYVKGKILAVHSGWLLR